MLVITFAPPPTPDTTAPETTLESWPDSVSTSTSASFTFSANETGATFACSLDGAPFAACASPAEFTGLALGQHQFAVQATDPSGNTDPTPASYTWTIEAPPPAADCGAPVTLLADADAWIMQNSPSNNMGSDSILKVQAKSSDNYRALVRFTLPALPAGCVVQSATLSLYASSWTNGRTLQALRITGAWSESLVTWSNQPTTTGPAVTTGSGGGYRQWSVTAQVQVMFDLGANHGFLIRDASESGGGAEQQFHSREKGETMPELVITFGP
jgi:hypothetical protein